MCAPHSQGARILDVGCGEGYCARKLADMGAKFIVGTDISKEMISQAKQAYKLQKSQLDEEGKFQAYLTGNATDTKNMMLENFAELHLLSQDIERGCFDLSIACFLFNYLSISDMNTVADQISQLLVPGGHFIFSVPHPLLAFLDQKHESTFKFHNPSDGKQYFSLRDTRMPGAIQRLKDDGNVETLKVRMMYKTFSDYIAMLRRIGFEIVDMVEAGVKEKHLKENLDFFTSVNDLPLHLIFKVRKPLAVPSFSAQHLPKKIIWDSLVRTGNIVLQVSPEVQKELGEVANCLADNYGVTADNFNNRQHGIVIWEKLRKTIALAEVARSMLMKLTGACLVRGFDLNAFDIETDPDRAALKSKLAYYIFCSCIGQVDGGARGTLFDVKSAGLSPEQDNVLYSVSNVEASWHSDGASVDRVRNLNIV